MTGPAQDRKPAENRGRRRSAARLAAVQTLYQVHMTGIAVDRAIQDFLSGRRPDPASEDAAFSDLADPDPGLFGALVRGVVKERPRLDEMIGAALTADWEVGRLEVLVRLILEAGVFELTERPEVPPKVAINEYMNVAHAFFEGAEPRLVNGVLDAVARFYRGGEMAGSQGGG